MSVTLVRAVVFAATVAVAAFALGAVLALPMGPALFGLTVMAGALFGSVGLVAAYGYTAVALGDLEPADASPVFGAPERAR